MNIYLASRYSRREELVGYKSFLEDFGHTVNSRWLNGSHQLDTAGLPIGDHGEALVEGDAHEKSAIILRQKFLSEDLTDVMSADWVISFTEKPREPLVGRGGRHVEFGIALYRSIILPPVLVTVIGYRENLFHWHPHVDFHSSWNDFVANFPEWAK